MSEQDRNAAARIDDLWNDEMLLAICAALQDCGITHARLGDNILPNAKRFRDALASAGYRLTAPDARSGTDMNALMMAVRDDDDHIWDCIPDFEFTRLPGEWMCCLNPNGDDPITYHADTPLAALKLAAAEGGPGERGEGE